MASLSRVVAFALVSSKFVIGMLCLWCADSTDNTKNELSNLEMSIFNSPNVDYTTSVGE